MVNNTVRETINSTVSETAQKNSNCEAEVRTRVGVLVSGGGTNLQAIIDAKQNGELDCCELCVVISSNPSAYALKRAQQAGIPTECIVKKHFPILDEYTDALVQSLLKYDVQLIVMAGYLNIVGESLFHTFEGRIINVHPSLIPAFSGVGFYGLTPHQKALEYGVKITGATTHFVSIETDCGPIILQKAVAVMPDDTAETLQRRVMEEAEWVILPETMRLYAQGRLKISGKIVSIL